MNSTTIRCDAIWKHGCTTQANGCATQAIRMARRYDSGVTQKLNSKGMTRKGGKHKAGLNTSILSVGFSTLNQMQTYKIE
jgi:hypothetical protein